MLITKNKAREINAGPSCTLWDYAMPSERFGFAYSHIDGRYPVTGRVRNRVCDKAYYVIAGSAAIHGEGQEFEISAGDVFLFEPGKAYWLEARSLEIVVCHAPPWSAEQTETCE